MPTGYTAPLQEGEMTLKQFVLRCSRAMGASIMQRDDSLDVEIQEQKASDYHQKKLAELDARMQQVLGYNDKQWEEESEQSYADELARVEKMNQQSINTRNRYSEMLAQVVQWEPPTSDHVGLKVFMIKQIQESIEWDCHEYEKPERVSIAKYKAETISTIHKDIAYHTVENEKEIERTENRNKWIRDLKKSFEIN